MFIFVFISVKRHIPRQRFWLDLTLSGLLFFKPNHQPKDYKFMKPIKIKLEKVDNKVGYTNIPTNLFTNHNLTQLQKVMLMYLFSLEDNVECTINSIATNINVKWTHVRDNFNKLVELKYIKIQNNTLILNLDLIANKSSIN
jgi:hypothetical protein